MKKLISWIAICLMAATLLAACGNAATPTPTTEPHVHSFTQWYYNLENHYYDCLCGETVTEAHNLDEYSHCDVCDVSVYDNGDGAYCILTYDEQGNMNSQTDYDADGTVLFSMICEAEYYEDGNPKHTWEYHNGVLLYECVYLPCENSEFSEVYLSQDTTYLDDGKIVMEMDEDWHILTSTFYDLEGNVVSQEVYEYELDEFGNVLKSICYLDGVLSVLNEFYMGPDGCMYDSIYISYENGEPAYTITYEHDFADTGDLTYQCIYVNGVKSDEAFYEADAEGFYYLAHEISYDQDGNVEAEYFYNSDGDQIIQ